MDQYQYQYHFINQNLKTAIQTVWYLHQCRNRDKVLCVLGLCADEKHRCEPVYRYTLRRLLRRKTGAGRTKRVRGVRAKVCRKSKPNQRMIKSKSWTFESSYFLKLFFYILVLLIKISLYDRKFIRVRFKRAVGYFTNLSVYCPVGQWTLTVRGHKYCGLS